MKLSLWFFVATIFLLYGVIIFGAGVYYWIYGVVQPNTVYHISVWWGLVLILVSCIFLFIHRMADDS